MTISTEAPAAAGSRWRRIAGAMSRAEWSRMGGMVAFIVAAARRRLGRWWRIVAPAALQVGTGVFGVGIGVTAYTLGMRHAFDADHIAAIDNTTRKLMAEGKRPLSVGFWFSLGHSSIVFALAFLLVARASDRWPARSRTTTPALHSVTGLDRHDRLRRLPLPDRHHQPADPGRDLARSSGEMRGGEYDEAALEEHLNKRGLMNRFLGRLMRSVTKPVADVPDRAALRPRLRHRHRGRAAGAGRLGRRRRACPGTRSCACRSCSPPGCACSTPSTARS